jgi:hypothetical protein
MSMESSSQIIVYESFGHYTFMQLIDKRRH